MTIGQDLDALVGSVAQNSADIAALKSAVAALQPASTPPPTPTDVITIKPVPNINFTFGLPASFSLAGFASSSLGLALTLALSGALPPGVTFDPVSPGLNYDGVGAVGNTSGCMISASDGRTP